MNATKNLQAQLMPMTVADGLTVNILPNEQFEFLMTTKEVAHGYGTSDYVVRKTMLRHSDEFIEGKHYVLGKDLYQKGGTKCPTLENAVTKCHTLFNAQPNQVFWTKRGVVRFGFYITSKQGKLFRDWAEDLIIAFDQQKDLFGTVIAKQIIELPKVRNHNRLTQGRLLDIMVSVSKIEDNDLRKELIQKLGL